MTPQILCARPSAMPAHNSPRFTVRLEPHEIEQFRELARKRGVTMADVVRPTILAVIKSEPVAPRPKGPRGQRKKSVIVGSEKTAIWSE